MHRWLSALEVSGKSKRGCPAPNGSSCRRAPGLQQRGTAHLHHELLPQRRRPSPARNTHLAEADSRGYRLADLGMVCYGDHPRRGLGPCCRAANPYLLGAGCHRYVHFQTCDAHQANLIKRRTAIALLLGARLILLLRDCLPARVGLTSIASILLSHTAFWSRHKFFHQHGGMDSQRQRGGCSLVCGQVFSS
jgi:hypothetical protein